MKKQTEVADVDYRMPTREDRLKQRKLSLVEALQQCQTTTPLSPKGQRVLDQLEAKNSKSKRKKAS